VTTITPGLWQNPYRRVRLSGARYAHAGFPFHHELRRSDLEVVTGAVPWYQQANYNDRAEMHQDLASAIPTHIGRWWRLDGRWSASAETRASDNKRIYSNTSRPLTVSFDKVTQKLVLTTTGQGGGSTHCGIENAQSITPKVNIKTNRPYGVLCSTGPSSFRARNGVIKECKSALRSPYGEMMNVPESRPWWHCPFAL